MNLFWMIYLPGAVLSWMFTYMWYYCWYQHDELRYSNESSKFVINVGVKISWLLLTLVSWIGVFVAAICGITMYCEWQSKVVKSRLGFEKARESTKAFFSPSLPGKWKVKIVKVKEED